jgi:hypothetical protein
MDGDKWFVEDGDEVYHLEVGRVQKKISLTLRFFYV